MHRRVLNALTAGLVLSLWLIPNPARGEPILVAITGGFAEVSASGGSVNIVGTDGFSLAGTIGDSSFFTGCCIIPGSPAFLFGGASGNDLQSTATFQGVTYTDVGGLGSVSTAAINFFGAAVTPSPATAPVALQVPFGASANLSLSNGGSPLALQAFGGGTATLFLQSNVGNTWNVSGMRFDFGGTSVVPEPATMLLLGMGVVGTYRATRKRGSRQALT